MSTKRKLRSQTVQESSTELVRNTIVFDIDGTLCIDCFYGGDKSTMEGHTISLEYGDDEFLFWPNWKILFDYLLSKDCYIVIYSAGAETRNIPLMELFLTRMYGRKKYTSLIRKGQFKVYSKKHLQDNSKQLSPLLRGKQTIDNIMLIDDMGKYASQLEPEMINVYINFPENIVSGLFGLFLTYFEEHSANMTLRKFVKQLLTDEWHAFSREDERNFIAKGLIELRKTDPDAFYYVSKNWRSRAFSIPDDLMQSLEYIKQVIAELAAGIRQPTHGKMKLFNTQFSHYYLHFGDQITAEEIEIMNNMFKE